MSGMQRGKLATSSRILGELERKVLWLASWMIHNANHLRENVDGLKVGGHQASSASLATIMTALYFDVLRPEDRVAVKPHASPIFHAIQYLLGRQTREQDGGVSAATRARRAIPRAPRTPTTSISPPARSASASRRRCSPRWCRTTCAPTAGGSRAAKAAWWRWSATPSSTRATSSRRCSKAGSRACAIAGGSSTTTARASTPWCARACGQRFEELFRAFGWDVVILKYGALLEAAFAEAGRRGAARLDRQLPEPALLGADVPAAAPPGASGSSTTSAIAADAPADRDAAPTTSSRG